MALISSLSNAVCDSDLTCVTIAGPIEYVGVGVVYERQVIKGKVQNVLINIPLLKMSYLKVTII